MLADEDVVVVVVEPIEDSRRGAGLLVLSSEGVGEGSGVPSGSACP